MAEQWTHNHHLSGNCESQITYKPSSALYIIVQKNVSDIFVPVNCKFLLYRYVNLVEYYLA
jgi:hypothetical protein